MEKTLEAESALRRKRSGRPGRIRRSPRFDALEKNRCEYSGLDPPQNTIRPAEAGSAKTNEKGTGATRLSLLKRLT
jgi:hypothetical protein